MISKERIERVEQKKAHERSGMIKKIYVAWKESGICDCKRVTFSQKKCIDCGGALRKVTEIERRLWYKNITQKTHLRAMQNIELERIIEGMKVRGFKVNRRAAKKPSRVKDDLIENVKKVARELLGQNWESRLNGFLRQVVKRDALEFCTVKDLRQLLACIRKT